MLRRKKKRFRKEEKQILVSSRADGERQGGHLTSPVHTLPSNLKLDNHTQTLLHIELHIAPDNLKHNYLPVF